MDLIVTSRQYKPIEQPFPFLADWSGGRDSDPGSAAGASPAGAVGCEVAFMVGLESKAFRLSTGFFGFFHNWRNLLI
jgi:hypothetical protein